MNTISTDSDTIWTFEHIRLKGFERIESEWVLKVVSVKELLEYYRLTRPSLIHDAFEDFLAVCDKKKKHFTNSLSQITAQLAETKVNAGNTKYSFVDSITDLLGKVERNQLAMLCEGHHLYMRDVGSYVHDNGHHYDVLDSHKSDKLIFPQSEIRLLQWKGGRHWYAKIGNVDVIVDDEQKWDTKIEAKQKALTYLNKSWKGAKVNPQI
jgi:hypothetical protein